MIDGIESARIGKQIEPDRAHEVRQDQIDNLPLIPDVIVGRDQFLEFLRTAAATASISRARAFCFTPGADRSAAWTSANASTATAAEASAPNRNRFAILVLMVVESSCASSAPIPAAADGPLDARNVFEPEQQRAEQADRAREVMCEGEGIVDLQRVAGKPGGRREIGCPVYPAALRGLARHGDMGVWQEALIPPRVVPPVLPPGSIPHSTWRSKRKALS